MLDGILFATIEPKNNVLPILIRHFEERYSKEQPAPSSTKNEMLSPVMMGREQRCFSWRSWKFSGAGRKRNSLSCGKFFGALSPLRSVKTKSFSRAIFQNTFRTYPYPYLLILLHLLYYIYFADVFNLLFIYFYIPFNTKYRSYC